MTKEQFYALVNLVLNLKRAGMPTRKAVDLVWELMGNAN